MRGLPIRRIAPTALCASLVLGLAAPAALAADGAAARERVAAASHAPVPGVAALLAQGKGLGDLSTVLAPVAETLNTVLKADDGRLTPDQATRLGNAVKTAVAKVTTATPAAPAAPDAPAAVPPAPAKGGDDATAKAAADPVSDALAAVQKAVESLLAAATSLDVGQVVSAVTGVVDGLLDLLSSTLGGLGLSLPSLPAEAAAATPAAPAPSLPPPPTR
ncbi:hypothetical protein [Streptomyces sp. NPDC058291]|jgi:hypothetical protein|uniref:hypothetical protein n=1 Tax=Streptomyces sp. NPDC058291 TaxID=3346427 RepID=UPI0036E5E993